MYTQTIFFLSHLRVIYIYYGPLSLNTFACILSTRIFSYIITGQLSASGNLTLIQASAYTLIWFIGPVVALIAFPPSEQDPVQGEVVQ